MEKSKHTPGPWKVFNSKYAYRPGIEAEEFSVVIFGEISESCGVDGRTEDEKEANAKLIAAAPELLEALRYSRRFLNSENRDVDYVDSVIKKAAE